MRRQRDKETRGRQDRYTDRQRETGRQMKERQEKDRQTEGQKHRHTDEHTYREAET